MDDKIRPEHLERAAYVYVRQSSMQQVRKNREGQQRQYGMSERARELGFSKIVVVDDDLGRSGSGRQNRPGFARLLEAVCEGSAGAVFALEASRLARNNRDWHHLIDLCALTDTLVIDEDGSYDPRQVNDRLLLGLKGTMSEFELGLLRQRAQEARKQMVRRGEVLWEVPVGFVRNSDNEMELTPDRQVQQAISGVFRKFRELGTARQVLLWYQQEKMPLPHAKPGTCGQEVSWRLPVYGRILKVLKNPFYAGAFVYGRTATRTVFEDGRARRSHQREIPLDEWELLIQEHHAGYISWSEYLHNRKMLESNTRMRGDGNSGAAKRGPALLAGLLRCARCGRMLHVTYGGKDRVPRYHCRGGQINHGRAMCLSIGGLRVDQVVETKVLGVLQPAGIEASLKAVVQLRQKNDEKQQALELALEKARYETERARRQYDAVEPENRLVAAELESRWNESLVRVQDFESRLQATQASESELTEDQHQHLMELGEDLQAAWNHPKADASLKKRILRTVLEEIVIDLNDEPPEIRLRLHWKGGAHTQLRTPKNRTGQHRRTTDRETLDLVRELAKVCKDRDIASILNRLGRRTGAGNHWKKSNVCTLRNYHKIPVFDEASRSEWITLAQAATELGVSATVVRRLIKAGTLPAEQVVTNAPWIIERENLDLPDVRREVHAVQEGNTRPRTQLGQLEFPLD